MKHITIKEWFNSVRKLGKIVKRLLRDMWPENKRLIVTQAICVVLTASLPFAIYWAFSRAIGVLSSRGTASQALWFIIGALLISFAVSLIQTFESFSEKRFWQRMQTKLNVLYAECKGKLSLEKLEDPEFRDIVSRAEEKPIWPALNIAVGQFSNLSNVIRLSAALVIVGAYDLKLCLWVVISLIPQFLVDIRHGTTLWMIFMGETDERRKFGEYSRHLKQSSSLVELKMFQNVEYFVSRIRQILQAFANTQEKAERIKHIYSGAAIIFGSVVLAGVLISIVLRVIEGVTPLSVFVFVWGSSQNMHSALSGALRAIAQQNEFALYATDMYDVMDAEPESKSRKGSIACADRIPEIVFDRVSFKYPHDTKQRMILRDVSFRVRPGERVALVGCNASGKTTLVRLLCGIYEPTEGRILIDGVDLREIDIQTWKKQTAVLFQNYARYNLLVRDIIALGNTAQEQSEEMIAEAARRSGVSSFITDLPEGYETQIGKDFKGGHEPSGGQSQRMALARVAYRRGKVVILDEPTASLDVFAEAEIFEELERHPKDATLIFITHRFSTIRNADHIIVLDHGKVIEEGNHFSLMEKNGTYAEMFNRQAKGYMSQPIEPEKE